MTTQESLYASLRTSVNRGTVTDSEVQRYLQTFRPQAARPGAILRKEPIFCKACLDHRHSDCILMGCDCDCAYEREEFDTEQPAAIWPREEE